jgi:hypothetical protein
MDRRVLRPNRVWPLHLTVAMRILAVLLNDSAGRSGLTLGFNLYLLKDWNNFARR